MYGEHWLADQIAPWLGASKRSAGLPRTPWPASIAVAILTYLHIVIGEMVPKALALQRADKTVLYVSPLIRALQHVLLPLVVVLNASATACCA